jgi:DNA-binding response OmpR family regulator
MMPEKKPLILMTEDDEDMARLNARMLTRKGYDVLLAFNAAEARAFALDNTPDLFVLDIELPDGDGFDLCKEIRQGSDAPVLFLTGRKALEDKVKGMNMGGDYYLVKPYSMEEFIAVAGRLLQKAERMKNKLDKAVQEATIMTRGTLTLQIPRMRVLVNDRDAELTPKEFAVLLMLVQNEDKELTGESIYESVWETIMNDDSGALRVHISRLKKKLDEENTDDFAILYRQGKGYVFTRK